MERIINGTVDLLPAQLSRFVSADLHVTKMNNGFRSHL